MAHSRRLNGPRKPEGFLIASEERINSVLHRYVTNRDLLFARLYLNENTRAGSGLGQTDGSDAIVDIDRFFLTLNPETRLQAAGRLTDSVFCTQHTWPELPFLRSTLLNRELSGTMQYPRYRDHSIHCLLAFLLGAFLFEHSRAFRVGAMDCMDRTAYERALKEFELRGESEPDRLAAFQCVMQDLFVSVLFHDIGYIFEGAHDPRNPWRDSGELFKAASSVSDFYRRAWPEVFLGADLGMASKLFDKIPPPSVSSTSISAAAESLRFFSRIQPDGSRRRVDAFEILAGSRPQTARWVSAMNALKFAYETLAWLGFPSKPPPSGCLLDHGIVSGLLLLQLACYFYDLKELVEDAASTLIDGDVRVKLHETISATVDGDMGILNAESFGATARRICGAAFHNIDPEWFDEWREDSRLRGACPMSPFTLELEEHGILYLTCLLDGLQEWDRQKFPPDPIEPSLDGLEVACVTDPAKETVTLSFTGSEKARQKGNQIVQALTKRLRGWDQLVRIEA